MRAYRIVKKRHVLSAFSGEGAKAYGGRWNRPGIPMVYAAESRALAALEALVRFQGAERHIELVVFEIEIPDRRMKRVDESFMPRGWRTPDRHAATQDLGSRWQLEMRSVALLVPSVLIPGEHCVLLNPEHPDSSRVMIGYPATFAFDDAGDSPRSERKSDQQHDLAGPGRNDDAGPAVRSASPAPWARRLRPSSRGSRCRISSNA